MTYTPVALSFAVAHADGAVELFIDPRKMSTGAVAPSRQRRLGEARRDSMGAALDALGRAKKRVRLDPSSAPSWAADRLTAAGAILLRGAGSLRAAQGAEDRRRDRGHAHRASARRRGAHALPRLARRARRRAAGSPRSPPPTGSRRSARRARSSAGSLSRPSPAPARTAPSCITAPRRAPTGIIEPGQRLSGRFRRAVPRRHHRRDAHGLHRRPRRAAEAPAEARDRFTRVLKGHIAVAPQRFPEGTNGGQLDPLARAALWQVGLDYDHGTGHGVGSYLGVHEGPQRIAQARLGRRAAAGDDRVQRARLLQDRRIRHPHREPGGGEEGREDRRVPSATCWSSRRSPWRRSTAR